MDQPADEEILVTWDRVQSMRRYGRQQSLQIVADTTGAEIAHVESVISAHEKDNR